MEKDSNQILECIFNTTNAMIAYLDSNFDFIRVNKRYAAAGGHAPEFYIGKNHFDLYPYSDNEEIFRRVVETGQPVLFSEKPFEYKEFPELGVTFWDWDLVPVKDPQGKVAGLILSLINVTKRKEAEDELRRTNAMLETKVAERTAYLHNEIAERIKVENALKIAKEEAEKANNVKSEYIANMSHELRTPLNVILSAIQLFDLHIKANPSSLTSKHFHHLKSMKQNCLRLLRLINNLIDTTKIDANFYELNLGNYDIVNIIKAITHSVTDYVYNREIALTFSTNIDKKMIACDIDMIERIMLNLLSNAIKFTEVNGSIDVTLIDRGGSIIISVKDSGIGIPDDKQKIIFDRYKQADRLLTRRHEGSGIGLSLVKSFAEALGGKISLNSKLGAGSEFIIELPCKLITDSGIPNEAKYDLNDYTVQKISVELSDLYSI
ncbi:MAG TPA: PAS domain-containing sensor histidine kinase [Anaerovoracaceae bacterium]|nr:PAS domain-containing sensor histidine kinase [Anaerovoracaceae bacterium]